MRKLKSCSGLSRHESEILRLNLILLCCPTMELMSWEWLEQKASDKVKQLNKVLHEKNVMVELLQGNLHTARQSEELLCEEFEGILSDVESKTAAIEWLHAISMRQSMQVRLSSLVQAHSLCFAG